MPFAVSSISSKSSRGNENDEKGSNLWVSYEDARSARKKAEYVKNHHLGGVSIWSLDMVCNFT